MSIVWLDDERSLLRIPFKALFRKWLDSLEQHGPADHHCQGIVVSGGATHVALMSLAPSEGRVDGAPAPLPPSTTAATEPTSRQTLI